MVLDQFRSHCAKHRLILDYQIAYHANYSCETALLKIANDILWDMETQNTTTLIAIDLSAAFDTVDYNTLIEVLHRKCGVAGTALVWFVSYLRPWFCRANVNNFYCIDKQLKCNVSQGSVAGPMLYTSYASMIESVLEADNQAEDTLLTNLRKKPDLHGFADDHAMKITFKASDNIKGWMDCNRLKINNGKTEFIMFGSKVQLAKGITNIININGIEVQRSEVIKYLGAWLDQNLTLTEHVNRKY